MENVLPIALFDLAFLAPPLAVAVGIMLLALPSRARKIASTVVSAHAV